MSASFNACTYLLDRRLREGDGDRLALDGPGGRFTYQALHDRVLRLAAGLRVRGVRPEERVVLFMADGPDMLSAILAVMRVGAVAVPVSTMLTGQELAALLVDARARVLMVSAPFALAAEDAAAGAPELRHLILEGDADLTAPPGVTPHRFYELLGGRDGGDPYDTWDDSPALWLYTSGTTGRPKGAMHRHANIRHVAETYGAQVLGITAGDRCLSVAKLFFAYGIGNSLFFPFSVGAATVLEPARPTPALVADRLREERPTLFFAVPTFYAALLSAGVPKEAFSSVRLAVSAGEPLPADLYRRFTETYGVELLDGIGATEALHIFISNRAGQVRPGTTGTPVPGYELRLLDEHDGEAPPGSPGSLHVRGESIATGYWCRTETTRQVFRGQWLRTGDTYVASEDGFYTFLGRTDDMVKASGIWVSPAEVEARLIQHPAVALAAVVGIPDADGLDKPVACVVLEQGATATAGELIDFCREGLASFKRPREVLFVDKIPTTATGKLQRFAAREIAAGLLKTLDQRADSA
jgi:benzoate-CoA ligase family protein